MSLPIPQSILVRILLCIVLPVAALPLGAQPSGPSMTNGNNEGTEFWIAFPDNFKDSLIRYKQDTVPYTVASGAAFLEIAISARSRGKGFVEIPGLGFRRDFDIEADSVVAIAIDSGAAIRSAETVEKLGVHVVTTTPVVLTARSTRLE